MIKYCNNPDGKSRTIKCDNNNIKARAETVIIIILLLGKFVLFFITAIKKMKIEIIKPNKVLRKTKSKIQEKDLNKSTVSSDEKDV